MPTTSEPFPDEPTVEFLQREAQQAEAEGKLEFDHPHVRERLEERGLTMRHVLECIRSGAPVGQPSRDQYGDWRLKLQRYVAGRRVQVVLAVKQHRVVVVTAI